MMVDKFVWVEAKSYIESISKPKSRHVPYLKRALTYQCLPVVVGVLAMEMYFMLKSVDAISVADIKFTIMATVSTLLNAIGAVLRLRSKIELIDGAFYINGICHYYNKLDSVHLRYFSGFSEVGFLFKNGLTNYYWLPPDTNIDELITYLTQRDVEVNNELKAI